MTVRLATPSDVEAIERIRIDAWREAYRDILPGKYLDSLDEKSEFKVLEKLLHHQSNEFSVLIAELMNEVSGFAMIGKPRYETGDNVVELYALNVAPAAWGQGLGATLLDHVLGRVESNGTRLVELWCIEENQRARDLYERKGFSNSGRKRESSGLTGHPLREVCYLRRIEPDGMS